VFSPTSRWRWLTIFALTNLVCWLALTVIIGLLVSDEMDLGLETFVRQQQATVAAAWEQVSQNPSRTGARPTLSVERGNPTATVAWPAGSTPLPTPDKAATPGVRWPWTPTPSSPSEKATPQPDQALVSSPLLMSDPEISNLMRLNTEMDRSAPGRAVQIRYQETALNEEIAALLENNPALPYRDVRVDLKPDRVIVTGNVMVLGFRVSTETVGQVVVRDCLPHLEVETISLAGVLTPGFVKDEIKKMIREVLAWYPADYPLCLEQIVLEETRATVYGYCR
jgi:hypothetical protein